MTNNTNDNNNTYIFNETNAKIQEAIEDQINMHDEKLILLEKLVFWLRIIGIYFLIKIIVIIILCSFIFKTGTDFIQSLNNIIK